MPLYNVVLVKSSSGQGIRCDYHQRLSKTDSLLFEMSFRKRNIVIAQADGGSSISVPEKVSPPGVRPSPLDGRLTTSTGTQSLDGLLAGHAGLVMGTSLLIEEAGTTDFSGILLRYYAAEGVTQGHQVHVLGMNEAWGRELPGLSDPDVKSARRAERNTDSENTMKIAWRYEKLGESRTAARGGRSVVYNFCRTYQRILPEAD